MSDLELFKYGFLLRCAEEGLTQEETAARIQTALDMTKQAFLDPVGTAKTVINGGLTLGGLGLAGAAGVGAGAGWLGAKMTEPDADPAEAKTQELIETYRLFAEQAKRNAQRRRTFRPSVSGARLMR